MNRRILDVCLLFVALLIFGATSSILAPGAQAQFVSFTQASQHHGSAALPVGWTELQDFNQTGIQSGCTIGTTVCSFNVAPTTAGSVWVIQADTGNNTHIVSASS